MDKQPLNVAFATQKGGSGKSSLTVLVASYLHYTKGVPLAVIDCDFPQHSLYEMRERDSRQVMNNEFLKKLAYKQMQRPGRAAYPVQKCRVERAPDVAEELVGSGSGYDLLFYDLPGTVNSSGILRTIAQMDYIFAPVSADQTVLESTLAFLDVLKRMMLGKGNSRLKGLYLFWNQVDGREKNNLYERYEKVIGGMELPMLTTRIPDTKRFRKELDEECRVVFRSTLFAPDKRLLIGSGIPELSNEILSILIHPPHE